MPESEICVLPEATEKTECVEREPAWVNLPKGEVELTTNGRHDVGRYETALVNVDAPSGTILITENGDYDIERYATASVDVPQPEGDIDITTNGTYDVTDYETANVNVEADISEFWNAPTITTDTTSSTWLDGHIVRLPTISVGSGVSRLSNILASTMVAPTKLEGGSTDLVNLRQAFYGSAAKTLDLSDLIVAGNVDCYQLVAQSKVEAVAMPKTATGEANGFNLNSAFQGATSLLRVDMRPLGNITPSSTEYMFLSATALTTLIIGGHTVMPLTSNYSFLSSGISLNRGYVYVPDSLVDEYKAAQYWSTYAARIKGIGELPE